MREILEKLAAIDRQCELGRAAGATPDQQASWLAIQSIVQELRRIVTTAQEQHSFAEVNQNGKLVLLVEDQPEIREITTLLLQQYGFTVISAASGAEAIRLGTASPIDAAIIDLGLPDMNGSEVAKALHHLKIAILTGNSGEITVPEATVILQKPLGPGQLITELQRLLSAQG